MNLDKRLKKLEKAKDDLLLKMEELKQDYNSEKECKPKFESGWYKHPNGDHPEWIVYFDGKTRLYGFDSAGNWTEFYGAGTYDTYIQRYGCIPATKKEVKGVLIKEAKRRGFKKGVRFKSVFSAYECECVITDEEFVWHGSEHSWGLTEGSHGGTIFFNGKWAEIISNKVVINGEEMKVEGDIVSFGCDKFTKGQLREALQWVTVFNVRIKTDVSNRKITSIKLDSGVELTIDQLKEIVDNI